MILLIDNYDSFVHNLARYFVRLGHETRVVRNDAIDASAIERLAPEAIVLSPGPCTPAEAGCSVDVVRIWHEQTPILGVCLGHQAIAAAFDVKITPAPLPVHGRTSEVFHHGEGVFRQIPNPVTVCRYHSLVVVEDSLASEFVVDGMTSDGVIMAIRHRELPVVGVQFHPESILTAAGPKMLANFLQLAGLAAKDCDDEFVPAASPLNNDAVAPLPPTTPITF